MRKPKRKTLRSFVFSRLDRGQGDAAIIRAIQKHYPESQFARNPRANLATYRWLWKNQRV